MIIFNNIVTYAFSAGTGICVGGRRTASGCSGWKRFLPRHRCYAGAVSGIERSGDQPVGKQTDQQDGIHSTGHTCYEHLNEQ